MLYLLRKGKTPHQKAASLWIVAYHFIDITPRSTVTRGYSIGQIDLFAFDKTV